ncbi:MAG: YafY family transcriptional regulator [Lysobacterales bacterium]|nr:MAG: YafY family transcriptional regulator [Xanthomonadales bacterium]
MRADRLISIVLLLQANGRMTAENLATRLEVSQRTILRDMDALSSAGVPVVAERGTGGGWRLIGGYETKLTGLTPAEIRSLFLARPPALLAELGIKEAADAAWLKLRAALPVGVREQAEFVRQRLLIDSRNWRDAAESLTSLPVILESLWSDRRLTFLYEKTNGESSEREVDPLGLVARANRWYLVATKGDEQRTYRVSRIRGAQILPERCNRPQAFDLAAYWEASTNRFREHLPRYDATFLVTHGILPWVCYRSWRILEQVAAGERFRVSMRFDAPEEARQFALAFGAELEVLEPKELREYVIATARAVIAAYGESLKGASASGSHEPFNCSSAAPAPSMPGTDLPGP